MQPTRLIRFPGTPRKPHPLGPLLTRERVGHTVKSRVLALCLLIAVATPLIVAARLTPDPSGTGTHRQLGFQPCTVLAATGYPCPTCGMTTAFAHTVHGQWADAFRSQPMGLLLAVAAIICVGAAGATLVTGRHWRFNWYRISPLKTAVVILLLFAAAWAYKIITVAAEA
ncbi:MAG: DUF2752 domain-containing protein [Phycisphaerae bacterium]